MSDLIKALKQIEAARPAKQRYIDYYEGRHSLAFASDNYRSVFGKILETMRDNLCPIVVEALTDRMEVINFSEDAPDETAPQSRARIDRSAWAIWKREMMPLRSNAVHTEAVKTGEAFVIVWANEDGDAEFFVQDSRNCAILEDDRTGKPICGAKCWTENKRLRVTLYYPDRIEKYVTASEYQTDGGVFAIGREWRDEDFVPFADDDANPPEMAMEANPYGEIPLFRFSAPTVLRDCIPIQDALNKTICDALVAQEFAAYAQRYATGIELPENKETGAKELPFKAGINRLWAVESTDVNFGEFQTADLRQFLDVADAHRLEMARISGVPVHFFSLSLPDKTSGESLKTLEARFTKKIARMCLNFGETWARAMRFAEKVEGDARESLAVQWASPEQRGESEFLDTLGKKKDILEVPVDTLREEAGYSSEDIAKFNKSNEETQREATEIARTASVQTNGDAVMM